MMDEAKKIPIILKNIDSPYRFAFVPADKERKSKNEIIFNGAICDISPRQLGYNPLDGSTCMTFEYKWSLDTIKLFKSILLQCSKVFFEQKFVKNGIHFGNVYIGLKSGIIDVSTVLVKSNDAVHHPYAWELALSENPILPEHTNDVKIDVWNVDVQIDEMFGKQSGCIPKNSTGTIASSEMMKVREITEREKCKSSSKTMKCDESKPSTCSVKVLAKVVRKFEKSVEKQYFTTTLILKRKIHLTEWIDDFFETFIKGDTSSDSIIEICGATLPQYDKLSKCSEAMLPQNLPGTISLPKNDEDSFNNKIIIPDYMLEDQATEINGERYILPKNFNRMRMLNQNDDTAEMKSLLEMVKQIDDRFLLLNYTPEYIPKQFFNFIVQKHLKSLERTEDKQRIVWYHISTLRYSTDPNPLRKPIVLVGDINFLMYLPPICDNIQRSQGLKWNGPEALIFAADSNEAENIFKFCTIILDHNTVCLDLDTPSSELSPQKPELSNCKVLIVRLNRFEILTSGKFNSVRFVVIAGLHLFHYKDLQAYRKWLQTPSVQCRLIITSKYHLRELQEQNPFVVVSNYLDAAKFARIQFKYKEVKPMSKFMDLKNLLATSSQSCAIITNNSREANELYMCLSQICSNVFFNTVPNKRIECILICSDEFLLVSMNIEVLRRFQQIIHYSLPDNIEVFKQRYVLLKNCFIDKSSTKMHEISSVAFAAVEEDTPFANKLILELLVRKYHYNDRSYDKNVIEYFKRHIKKCVRRYGEVLCSSAVADENHLVMCNDRHFYLHEPSQSSQYKIDIQDVISPDEYLVRLLKVRTLGRWKCCPNNTEIKIRLTRIIPLLKNGYDYRDKNRILKFIKHPYKQFEFEANQVHVYNGFTYAENIIVHDLGTNEKIDLKVWMAQSAIALLLIKINVPVKKPEFSDDSW